MIVIENKYFILTQRLSEIRDNTVHKDIVAVTYILSI